MSIQYFAPSNLEEALQLLAKGDEYVLLAGGTDLVPKITLKHLKINGKLIYLGNITEMKTIILHNDYIFVGALVTHSQVAASKLIKEKSHNMWSASYNLGTPAVRNVGTVGGNLVNASPAGDTCVTLLAADAQVVFRSKEKKRSIPIKDFFVAKGQTAISPGEILYGIQIPLPPQNMRKSSSYKRISILKGSSTAITNLALEMERDDKNVCKACRIAVGAMSATPIRLTALEKMLIDQKTDLDLIDRVIEKIELYITPIDDGYATAWYRRKVVKVLLKEALIEASTLNS